eukprot:112575-Chlamydomonas_euryale.AAC.1
MYSTEPPLPRKRCGPAWMVAKSFTDTCARGTRAHGRTWVHMQRNARRRMRECSTMHVNGHMQHNAACAHAAQCTSMGAHAAQCTSPHARVHDMCVAMSIRTQPWRGVA